MNNALRCKPISLAHGFTLLEILIALLIFTIIAMLATGVLHTVIKAYDGTETKANRLTELQIALLLLSHDVPQSVDRPIINAIGKEDAAFIGTPRGFTLTQLSLANANSLLNLKHNPLQRKGFYWYKEKLWRVSWPALDQPPKIKAKSSILINDVSFASFSYLDSQRKMHDSWPVDTDPHHPLPQAVQIEMTLKGWGKISQTYVLVADAFKPIITPSNADEAEDKAKNKDDKEDKDRAKLKEEDDDDDGEMRDRNRDDEMREDIEDD